MFVSADKYSVIKNKWRNQQIHKIHNEIHGASKHYINYNHSKYPINQRKHRKKFECIKKRQNIYKVLAFDYDDFVLQNKNENYKRIHIRPTMNYHHNGKNIDAICNQFYNYYHLYDDYSKTMRKHNRNINTKYMKYKATVKSATKLIKKTPTQVKKQPKIFDSSICFECDRTYDLPNKQCSYCQNTMWLQSLFEGNKIDIFDNKYKNWYIGTIIKVTKKTDEQQNINFNFVVHYDGFKSIFDELIRFNFGAAQIKLNKIKKLHSITSYHAYEQNKNNIKSCVARQYKKCVLCKKKYCLECQSGKIMSNECDECLKSIMKNKWLNKIQRGDKMDVYLYGYRGAAYDGEWHCGWHIGTVIDFEITNLKLQHKMQLYVHYDGLEAEYDELINVDCWSKLTRNKLKKLNKLTLVHNYLLNKKQNICVEMDKYKKCISCYRKCCLKCLVPGIIMDGIGYQCNQCGIAKEEKDMFNSIKQSLYGKYCTFGPRIQMNIIYIIYEYSLGITIRCCNQIKHCSNEINFDSRFEMESNAQQNAAGSSVLPIYQYYLSKNQRLNTAIPNVMIYNKKRRIFCQQCTKHALIKCILCNKYKEIRSTWINNITYKCPNCLDSIVREKQTKKTIVKSDKKKAKVHAIENKYVDIYFKNFKDTIVPQIELKKSRTKQNIKSVGKLLQKYHINVENLPYNIWSMECKFKNNCRRKYCAFYHCDDEQKLGGIVSILAEKIKFEKQIVRDKSRYYCKNVNDNLMDYNFNIQYVFDKSVKHRNNNVLRKYNVKRETKKRRKNKAYYSRKGDKKSNVKSNKKFKAKYCFNQLQTYF